MRRPFLSGRGEGLATYLGRKGGDVFGEVVRAGA